MLVLSRKKNETIVIAGGLITLTIVEVRGDKIRIGIEAPRDVSIHRGEVQALIDSQVDEAIGGADAHP